MSIRTMTTTAILGALVGVPAVAQDLTISVYGIAQDEYDEALYTPFEEICGCEITVETGNNSERLAKLEANAESPVIDVIAFSDASALEAANSDLIAPLDMSQIPNAEEIYDFAKDPLGNGMAVGYTFYATSIVTAAEDAEVGTWQDLFDEGFDGRIALPNITTTQGPLTLYMIQRSIDAEAAEAGDLSDAIELVAANRDKIVTFYERSSQIPQLLQQGEILGSVIGRYAWPGLSSLPVDVEWVVPEGGQTGGMNVLAAVAGSENSELAHEFINYWLSEEVQTKVAQMGIDSPVNTNVSVTDEEAEAITYGAEMAESIHFLPPAVQIENRDGWLEAWNTQVAR